MGWFSDKNTNDPVDLVNALGAQWSPDFDAYASGRIDISQVRSVPCAHCGKTPCEAFTNPTK